MVDEYTFVELLLEKALKEYPKVKELKLHENSSMGEFLKTFPKKKILTTIAFYNNNPIAWSWLFHQSRKTFIHFPLKSKCFIKRYYLFWTYVAPEYRRKGLGTELFNRAKFVSHSRHRPIRVEPWDARSKSFYKSMNAKSKWST